MRPTVLTRSFALAETDARLVCIQSRGFRRPRFPLRAKLLVLEDLLSSREDHPNLCRSRDKQGAGPAKIRRWRFRRGLAAVFTFQAPLGLERGLHRPPVEVRRYRFSFSCSLVLLSQLPPLPFSNSSRHFAAPQLSSG